MLTTPVSSHHNLQGLLCFSCMLTTPVSSHRNLQRIIVLCLYAHNAGVVTPQSAGITVLCLYAHNAGVVTSHSFLKILYKLTEYHFIIVPLLYQVFSSCPFHASNLSQEMWAQSSMLQELQMHPRAPPHSSKQCLHPCLLHTQALLVSVKW